LVEILQYEGQNLFWSKTERPNLCLAVNYVNFFAALIKTIVFVMTY